MAGYSEKDSDRWSCIKSGKFFGPSENKEINTAEGRDDDVQHLALFVSLFYS
jgi:hypothetical protein